MCNVPKANGQQENVPKPNAPAQNKQKREQVQNLLVFACKFQWKRLQLVSFDSSFSTLSYPGGSA